MASLPNPVLRGVTEALADAGHRADIREARAVSGGSINRSVRLEAEDGTSWFLKWNADVPSDFFADELDGLRALRNSGSVRVPEALAAGGGGSKPGWLLLEWIESARPGPEYDEELGRGLGHLHGSASGTTFGWERDNWIGSLRQTNAPAGSWAKFWRDRRLEPQLRRAVEADRVRGTDRNLLQAVMDRVGAALPPSSVPGPDLLHGDLWSGNALADSDGRPVILDPAVYHGHGEVDLAMMELFGGFGAGVRHAYEEVRPVPDAFDAYRKDLYQLYYLLVHVNLFGRSYLAGTRAAARRVVEALG